jgi:hypothetical protein
VSPFSDAPLYTGPGLFMVPAAPLPLLRPGPATVVAFALSLARILTIVPPKGEDGMDFTQPDQTCQLGDAGVVLAVQLVDALGVPFDISAGTNLVIKIGMPDGSTKDFPSTFLTNGSDGFLSYATQLGDLNQLGQYTVQGKLTLLGGPKSSFVGTFTVLGNVDNN